MSLKKLSEDQMSKVTGGDGNNKLRLRPCCSSCTEYLDILPPRHDASTGETFYRCNCGEEYVIVGGEYIPRAYDAPVVKPTHAFHL